MLLFAILSFLLLNYCVLSDRPHAWLTVFSSLCSAGALIFALAQDGPLALLGNLAGYALLSFIIVLIFAACSSSFRLHLLFARKKAGKLRECPDEDEMMKYMFAVCRRISNNRRHCLRNAVVQSYADRLIGHAQMIFTALQQTPDSRFKPEIVRPLLIRFNESAALLERLNVESALTDSDSPTSIRNDLDAHIASLTDASAFVHGRKKHTDQEDKDQKKDQDKRKDENKGTGQTFPSAE